MERPAHRMHRPGPLLALLVPLAQGRHLAWPETATKEPAAQASQLLRAATGATLPAGHGEHSPAFEPLKFA